jgi:subtilisin family serine protease
VQKSDQRKKKTAAIHQAIECLETRLMYAVHNDSFDVTYLTELRSDPAYTSITGKGIGIAVLDTGVDAANPDLTSKVVAFYNAVEDAIPTSISSSSVSSAVDNDGHGTHVSGIAASSDSSIGVADGASLIDVKVIADSGETQLSGDPLLRGLEFVAEYASQFNIKVVNMSLGESTSSGGVNDNTVPAADDISREIQTLEKLGITVVAAAGNSYANDPVAGESYPAVVSTISVANVWSDSGDGYDFDTYSYGTADDSWAAVESSAQADQLAATSQRSTLSNQVAAPGMNIYSDWNGTSTDNSGSDLLHNTISGTSMAAPFISGVVALIQQAAYVYGGQYISNPEEVLAIIKQTATTIQDPESNYGDTRVPISDGELTGGSSEALPGTGDNFDLVNAYQAIQEVKALYTGTISTADTNNTIATATAVPDLNGTSDYNETGNIGTDGLNNVGANDVDLYTVTLDETGSLTATLSATSGGTDFTAAIRLFNSSGGQIDIAVGNSSAGYPTITTDTGTPLATGTYYIGVSSAGNVAYDISDGSGATGGSTTGDYTLTVALGNPDPNGVPAGAQQVDLTDPNYEANNGVVSNYFQGILGSDPPPTGSDTRVTVANGDVDMFQVVAPDTGTLTATADVSQYGFEGADSYIEVFDSNLNLLTENGQVSGFPSSSQVEFNVTEGDIYYVAVTVAANANFSPTDPYTRVANSTETPTDYDLYLTFNNGNTDGTALLAHSETIGNTTTGDIGSSNASFGAAGGSKYVDWYDYTASSAGLLDLSATATSTGFSPSIEFWTLSTNSSGGTGITEVGATTGSGQPLIYQVTAGETIYASVTGAGNSNFNWYSLGSGSGGETGTYSLTSSLLSTSQLTTLNDGSIDYGTPQTITAGQSVAGDIGMYHGLIVGASDVDLYKFVPTTSGEYDIDTDTSQEGSVDTYLRLFDASGNQLASNDNANDATTASLIVADLVAGQTYYIGVSGTGNEAYDAVSGSGATASTSTGTYVLSVASSTVPALMVSSPAAVSPTVSGTSIVFTVSLSYAATSNVTVDYTTVDDTAFSGTEYTATSGTLTFLPGEISLTVSVPILLDASATGTTTFSLDLTNPSSNAIIDGGQGTGTISNLPVTQLDFSAKKIATYTDSTGHKVEFIMSGPGSGVVSVVGTSAEAVDVTVTGTTNRSHIEVSSNAKVDTTLNMLQINGSLSTFDGAHVELDGNLTVTGTIGTLVIAGATGSGTLSIAGTGTSGTLELGDISDLNLMSSEPLNALVATNWTNLSNTDVITAPLIRELRTTDAFGAALAVGGGGAALDTVRIGGAITGGDWNINGTTGTIVAASTALTWNANFSGAVTTLDITGDASGSITAGSIRSMIVRNNFSSGTLNLTGAGTAKSPDIQSLSVGGIFSDSVLRSAGDIDIVRLGAIDGSTLDAGVSNTVTGLASSVTDFVSAAEIESFTLAGIRGTTFSAAASNISAADLGKVVIRQASPISDGTVFNFAAESLTSLVDAEPGQKTFVWVSKEDAAALNVASDFVVNLV